jgi:CO/xanthine dehydrogenase Mo-binding subunit
MIVAEELGIPLDRIEIEQGDTGTTQYGKPGGGSHSVVVYGPAVRLAALDVRRQVLQMAAGELKVSEDRFRLEGGKVVFIDSSAPAVPYQQLKALRRAQTIVGIGQAQPDPEGKLVISFAAQFAEVEVNTKTGEIKVLDQFGTTDTGRVMNRLTAENQVLGGMIMGLGFALTEKRIIDKRTGRMVNVNLHDYKVPTAKDAPLQQSCLPMETKDSECNNLGAKGLGELGVLATAPAIANAIYNAMGVRVPNSPVTPIDMLRLLSNREGKA